MPKVFKRKYKSLNEEFADQYKGNYLVSDNTTGLDPHVNADYVKAANDFEKSKKVMKDDFKELDKAVTQFISEYELEEVPKKIKSTPQLKAMKLSENRSRLLREGYYKLCMVDEFGDEQILSVTYANSFDDAEQIFDSAPDLQEYWNDDNLIYVDEMSEDDYNSYTLNESCKCKEEVSKKVKSNPQLKEMKLSESYIDTTGTFVAPGETVTEEQLKAYFDMNKDEDPILAEYVSYKGWLDDSVKSGYLIKEGLTESVMLDVNELPEISMDMIEDLDSDDSDDDDKEELKECSDDKDAWDDLYEQLKNN